MPGEEFATAVLQLRSKIGTVPEQLNKKMRNNILKEKNFMREYEVISCLKLISPNESDH